MFVASGRGQVKNRAEPDHRGGVEGVLNVTGPEPNDRAAGNGSRAVQHPVVRPVPLSRCYPARAVSLAAVIPSLAPALTRGMGGPRQGRRPPGSIKLVLAPPVAAGQTEPVTSSPGGEVLIDLLPIAPTTAAQHGSATVTITGVYPGRGLRSIN